MTEETTEQKLDAQLGRLAAHAAPLQLTGIEPALIIRISAGRTAWRRSMVSCTMAGMGAILIGIFAGRTEPAEARIVVTAPALRLAPSTLLGGQS